MATHNRWVIALTITQFLGPHCTHPFYDGLDKGNIVLWADEHHEVEWRTALDTALRAAPENIITCIRLDGRCAVSAAAVSLLRRKVELRVWALPDGACAEAQVQSSGPAAYEWGGSRYRPMSAPSLPSGSAA